ncbi:hypothetical protein AURDEDRAFT_172558 [Auricularia subglabra TFB-10046 SS5]|nr:hypothetical protein AURDEDRAFT_172558 [Auricularia subglabra TFB-10046 SS5]
MSATSYLAHRLSSRQQLLELLAEWDQNESDDSVERQAELRVAHALDLSDLDEDICRTHFRFSWPEIVKLAAALQLPDEIIADNRIKADTVPARHITAGHKP